VLLFGFRLATHKFSRAFSVSRVLSVSRVISVYISCAFAFRFILSFFARSVFFCALSYYFRSILISFEIFLLLSNLFLFLSVCSFVFGSFLCVFMSLVSVVTGRAEKSKSTVVGGSQGNPGKEADVTVWERRLTSQEGKARGSRGSQRDVPSRFPFKIFSLASCGIKVFFFSLRVMRLFLAVCFFLVSAYVWGL